MVEKVLTCVSAMLYYKRVYNKYVYGMEGNMPSSPKIKKEDMLRTALGIVMESGYAALNIKAVAKEAVTESVSHG